jgi:myo-inositol-1(or 4)-monophosphatase
MKLSPNDLISLSKIAISAAKLSGELISAYTNQKVAVKNKVGGDSLASQVVTEVDLKSQEIILEKLSGTLQKYDLALLTEESIDDKSRLEKDYFWCIDPLDGTLPFVEGSAGYAVSIALVSREGIPYIGVIYDPVEQTLYHAIKGEGAFRNGQPWKLVPEDSSKQSLTIIGDRSSLDNRVYNDLLVKLDALNLIHHGGAVMNACWVLEKAPACYFKLPKSQPGGGSSWDFAATACLFTEYGAVVSDIYGDPLNLNRPDSTFLNHRGVLYASDKELARQVREVLAAK